MKPNDIPNNKKKHMCLKLKIEIPLLYLQYYTTSSSTLITIIIRK